MSTPSPVRRATRFAFSAATLILALLLTLGQPAVALAAGANLSLTLSTAFPIVQSGAWAVVNLSYSCSSVTTTPCEDATVTAVLPPELAGGIGDVQAFGAGTTPSYNPATRTITWAFNSAIVVGAAGTLELRVRFPAGSTPDGTTATLRAEMRSTTAPPKLSNPLTLIARAQATATADKSLVSGGAPDVPTTYSLRVCIPSGGTGVLNLSNVLITDTLPLGATFLSASDGGVASGGLVTWPPTTLTLPANACATRTVTVRFPSASFAVGAQLRNDLSVSAQAGSATLLLSDSDVRLLQPPTPGFGFAKTGPTTALAGDVVAYTLSAINTGTAPLADAVITDTIPPELDVTRIGAGGHNLTDTVRLAVEYATSLNATFAAAPGSPITGAACYNIAPTTGGGCATITLAGGERVTAVRWRYLDPLPFGFAATGHTLQAKVTSTPVNAIIVNQATGSYSYNGVSATRSGEARTRISEPGSRATVVKAASPAVVYAGGTLTYTVSLNNTSVGGSTTAITSPVLADLLIASLSYVPGSSVVTSKPAGAPDPLIEVIPNYRATGRTLLRWRWDGYSLPADASFTLRFQATVNPSTLAGTLDNTAALASFANPPGEIFIDTCNNRGADSNDLDGDGITSELICSSTISSVSLARAANTDSLKLVLGQLDSVWTRDPLTGGTTPGGMADYQLVITNTNTVPLTGLVLIDILPWVGDVGVVRHDEARGTQWRPYLIGPISAPAGATVYYSTATNPCRNPELGLADTNGVPVDSPGCIAPAWSTVPPADITTVGAVKIDFGALVLQPQDSVLVTWPMRAPVGGTASEIAWNTFGYRARDLSDNYLPAAEPARVGIERTEIKPPAYGDYVWFDGDLDGVRDAGEPGVNGARIDFYEDNDGTPGPSAADRFVAFTVSGPDNGGNPGFYLFSDPDAIPPGNYYTIVTPPAGYGLTVANAGADDAVDSDVDPLTRATSTTQLVAGEIDLIWDVGLITDTAVGNYVWIDRDADGVQNEPASDGVNGVTVRLYDPGANDAPGGGDDTLLGTTVTGDDPFGQPGYYIFAGLNPGSFFIEFALPTGFAFTTPLTGTTALDSDAAAAGRTAVFSLTAKQLDLTRDAGLTLVAGSLTLGDRVWGDLDNDGLYEPLTGEQGIDNVRLSLYRDFNADGLPDAGEYVAGTTTRTVFGVPGYYQFSGLASGAYLVVVDPDNFTTGGALAGMRSSTGNDPASDPDDDRNHDDNGDLLAGLVRTLPITLAASGEPTGDGDGSSGNQTLDLGFISGAALGDRVWFDTNGDGLQTLGEPGVAGVTVELLDGAGLSILGTATTDGSGRYGFTQLAAGTYRVRYGVPLSHTLTITGAGALSSDSDPDPATRTTLPITLTDGQSDLTWDAGLVATPASLGDLVWDDQDRDGVQDASEPGMGGVTASLYSPGPDGAAGGGDDTFVASTTTTLSGAYSFAGLPPGAYYVLFSSLPAGYTVSPNDRGGDDANDSDADPSTLRTAVTTLSPGESDPTWDLGLYAFASLGDRVWNDTNNNGLQDGGETGVPNVTVRLYRPGSSVALASTTTSASGAYSFTNLAPGLENIYYLEFVLPNGYRPSASNQGGDDTLDSDPGQSTYQTITTTLTAGQNDTSWDFGIFPAASIGDLAWLDLDADGVQDAGETSGVPAVQVVLYDGAGAELNTTVTDATGAYRFGGLAPGSYTLRFIPPASYLVSPRDQGADDAADSDVSLATFRTITTTLSAGMHDLTWDIGLYQPSSLGDLVWHDADGDGLQDSGEPGVPGVLVELYQPGADGAPGGGDDIFVVSTITTLSGTYLFENLAPGAYFVQFGAAPGYSLLSPRDSAAATDETDSDVDAARRSPVVNLGSSTIDLSLDMGVLNPASLGDYLWFDADVDGIQDGGESGVAGVTATLFTGDGITVTTTTTGINGGYLFSNLAPGEYYVVFSDLPANRSFTRPNQGGDDSVDSDATQGTRYTYDASGNVTGSMIVGVTSLVRLVSGGSDLSLDGGIYETISLGDRVWIDGNANGVQDAGETDGVAGVRVELLRDSDGAVLDYTYTDSDGLYLFSDLYPGTYRVRFGAIPPGYQRSPQGQGGDLALDSDADATFTTSPISPTSGSDLRYDLGLYQPAAIGNLVWLDSDADGVQGAGEPGIAGVTVSLSGIDGAGNPVSLSTTTGVTGTYGFTDLVPGVYTITVTAPASHVFSARDRGGDDSIDSDTDAGGQMISTDLTSGESDQTWDAGLYQYVRLGDLVWNDLNNNGTYQSATESGLDGVTVNLYRDLNSDGDVADAGETTAISTTTTAGGGLYSFAGLEPGSYVVELPAGNFSGAGALAASAGLPAYRSSTGTNGSPTGAYEGAATPDPDTNVNGDDNGTTDGAGNVRTLAVTLRSQGEPVAGADGDDTNGNLTVDFGLFRPLSLGNLVWNDLNNNRSIDGGEPGIQGVAVQLRNSANTATISTTTTSATGAYTFTNLVAGDYIVRIPSSNFSGTGRLLSFRSSDAGSATDAAPDPDNDDNSDDNGVGPTGGRVTGNVNSGIVTLSVGGEPANDGDTSTTTNLSLDFGFYSLTLGNLVFNDRNNNGLFDSPTESGVSAVTVALLYDADNSGTLAGAETTPVFTTTTATNGRYLIGGLRDGGSYAVQLTLPANYVSSTGGNGLLSGPYEAAPDPDSPAGVDNDDNGTFASGSLVRTLTFTMTVGGEPVAEPDTTMPTGVTNAAADNASDLSVDFGIFDDAAVGNLVWLDTNGNGIQDGGEITGVAGVTVTIYSAATGQPLDGDLATPGTQPLTATTTAANPNYSFTRLISGTYHLVFSGIPAQYVISPQDQGANNAVDSDAGPPSLQTATITLTTNTDNDWDLGLYPRVSLGNLVWYDANDDGLKDAGESGIGGVTVELYRDLNGDGDVADAGETTPISTTTTATSVVTGTYSFSGLEQGSYVIAIPASEFASGQALYLHRSSTGSNGAASGAYEPAPDPDTGLDGAVGGGDDDRDNDDNGSAAAGGVASRAITLSPSAEPAGDGDGTDGNQTIDFGFFEPLSLGNLVWDDRDNSGTVDAGESGIAGVEVQLFLDLNGNGAIDDGVAAITTTTSLSGTYSFSDLIEGAYIARIPAAEFGAGRPLAGYVSSSGTNGGATGPYEGVLTPDADLVVLDDDDNGTTDGSSNVNSLAITLSRGAEPNAATDGDGTYGNQTLDFGLFQPASLGDRVWHDVDANGAQGLGEPGVQGVTITLYRDDDGTAGPSGGDTVVGDTLTDATGLYTFTNLRPSDYYLAFAMPAGYTTVSAIDRPGDDTTDSDADPLTHLTAITALGPGESDPTWDMGVYNAASIGNFVWEDTNGNAVQDSGEPAVAGVRLTLGGVDGDGNTVSLTTTTDISGTYIFSGLAPGAYSVTVSAPAGYLVTARDRLGDDALDSDADPATGAMASTILTSGEDDPSWDVGLFRPAAIGDIVWHDANADGMQDAGEAGLQGVTVGLSGVDGTGASVSLSATTDATGIYSYTGLVPGVYTVTVTAPGGYIATTADAGDDTRDSDADPATGVMASTVITSGEEDLSWDAGFFEPVSLGDLVFEDFADDGSFSAGADLPIVGAEVGLYGADGLSPVNDLAGTLVASRTTGADGLYLFANLRPGAYVVRVVAPAGYQSSTDITSTKDADGDLNDDDNGIGAGNSAASGVVALTSGGEPTGDGDGDATSNLSVDFGFFRPAAIGDLVWLDADRDGAQGVGEAGLSGVTVELWRDGGATALLTATTGAGGDYHFDRLPTGDYFVRFVAPPDFDHSPVDAAADDATDSDADQATGATAVTTLDPGEEDLTWDAGLFYAAGLGNRVWLDRDADGVQGAGESGLAGVTVTLLDDTGAISGTDTTDSDGFYGFSHLPSGTYQISFTVPAGYLLSPRDGDGRPDADSDADAAGLTELITLAPGAYDPTWDAGLYQLLSLGDLVWEDTNNNGAVDSGEAGLAGVAVSLFADADADAAPDTPVALATAITDAGGRYRFDELRPGRYLVEITVPAGYRTSTGTPGAAAGPYEPAPSPDDDHEGDDNGTVSGAKVRSGTVTLWSQSEPGAVVDGDETNGNMSVDFGLFRPASLGSTVWYDRDGDGRQGAGESGVPGVIVTLYHGDGTPARDAAGRPLVATTDANGKYLFTNLTPGSYLVGFTNLPAGYTFTVPGVGDDDGDSDASPVTGLTVVVTLRPGEQNLTLWAGLINPTAISLINFTAERVGADVNLRWATGAEWETWGFHILRSTDGTRASAVRVTPDLIVARGGPQLGAAYFWRDAGAPAGASYWLEEIELGGATHEYGPVSPRSGPRGLEPRVFLPALHR